MADKHWAVESSEALALLAEQSAILTLRGIGINEQVKQLQKEVNIEVTRTRLVTLKKHPKYREILKSGAEEIIDEGKISLKTGISELVPEIIKCLRTKIQEGDVKAAVAAINALNDKKDEDGVKQAQQLTVVLPGGTKTERPV